MTNKPILKLKVTTYPSASSELTTYYYDDEFEDLVKNAVEIGLLNIGLIGRFLPGFTKKLKSEVVNNIITNLEGEGGE